MPEVQELETWEQIRDDPSQLEEKELLALRKKAEEDFYVFSKGVCGFDWLVPKIHMPMCIALEDYKRNRRIKFTLPRGWLKTTLGSCAYPLWRGVKDSNVRFLLTQNTYTNACSKLGRIKGTVEGNALFRALWPEVLPTSKSVWSKGSLCLTRSIVSDESTYEAAGIRTQVTSRHYDIIVEDDTVAPELDELGIENIAPRKEDVAQAIGWHRLAAPLLVSPKESQIIVIGTRWFEEDLLSWISDNEPQYFSYSRASRETDGEPDDSGIPVYPERFDDTVLDELQQSLGPYMYSCLFMNQPLRSKDMVFLQEWFQFYETEPVRLITYTTVDPAGDPDDTKGEPDWNVVLTCGKDMRSGNVYVLEYSRQKCSPSVLIDMIFHHVQKWHPVKIGLETVAYQKSLQYWIRERQRTQKVYFLVEGLTHNKTSKEARIVGLQPLVCAGKLKFRGHMTALINELLSFPLGKHDDLADALSMQLEMWFLTTGEPEAREEKYNNDPLSFNRAVEELRGRHQERLPPPLDILADRGGRGGILRW